jgi:cysteine desulfurase
VRLREDLITGVLARIPNVYLIGDRFRRLPGHVCLGFAGLEGESIKLLLALDEAGVSVSAGSACSAHKASEPSYVLTAMGFDALRARGGLRITLGRFNTKAEVDRLLEILPRAVATLSPVTGRLRNATGVGR